MSMRARKLVAAGTVVLGVGMVLAGCGGGGGGKKSASSGGGGGATIQLTAKDFSFTPDTATAKVGQKVTVTLKNNGSVEHNFSISSLNVDKDAEKGGSATATFTPTQAG